MSIDINSINPYIRRAINSCLKKESVITKRVIFDYELIYIEKGSFVFEYNGSLYDINENTFILVRPNVTHAFYMNKQDLWQPHIHFDLCYNKNSGNTPISFKDAPNLNAYEQTLMQTDAFLEYPQNPIITLTNKRAKTLFYEIIRDEYQQSLTVKAKMVELINYIIEENFSKSLVQTRVRYHIAKQLKDFLDSGQGLCFSLDDLEKQFSYSKFYLERQFKKEFSVSLIAYRNERRMKAAKEMLCEMSVSQVAEKLGFQSIYAFSNSFKKRFGYSPKNQKFYNK